MPAILYTGDVLAKHRNAGREQTYGYGIYASGGLHTAIFLDLNQSKQTVRYIQGQPAGIYRDRLGLQEEKISGTFAYFYTIIWWKPFVFR